jgi:hypothetical protein
MCLTTSMVDITVWQIRDELVGSEVSFALDLVLG